MRAGGGRGWEEREWKKGEGERRERVEGGRGGRRERVGGERGWEERGWEEGEGWRREMKEKSRGEEGGRGKEDKEKDRGEDLLSRPFLLFLFSAFAQVEGFVVSVVHTSLVHIVVL